jgi:ABC-2 type transport system permease protein
VNKYWHVVRIGIQNTLVYRFNFLARSAFSLVPLMATLYLWQTIYEGREGNIGGYSLGKMISYYLMVLLVDTFTAVTDDDWQVAADIKDGNINQFLLKPMDYLYYRFCLYGAGRLVFTLAALLPAGLFILYHRADFYLPGSAAVYGWFLLSLVLTGFLQFLISYTMALLAFWVLEVSTLILMLFALEYVAGGQVFPLDILPPSLAAALAWTPFPYELFLTVGIYLEQVSGAAMYRGLLIQCCWVVIMYGVARWVWFRGIKRYSAVGG